MTARRFFYPILRPISILYDLAMTMRRRLYQWGLKESFATPLPSIVIGNLTMGGTGKTPVVSWLISEALAQGRRPILVTRGHKGKAEHNGKFVSAQESTDSTAVGDEPAMLKEKFAAQLSLCVGKNRLKMMQSHVPFGVGDLFIWDDGYQYLKLKKDFSILLFDATVSLSKYAVFPLGHLRESWESARTAQAFIMTKWNLADEANRTQLQVFLEKKFPEIPKYKAEYFCTSIKSEAGVALPRGSSVLAFAGLGNNQSFFDLLKQQGLSIKHYGDYPDHYRYSKSSIENLQLIAKQKELQLVCSEKDWVKLKGRMTIDCFVAKMELKISPVATHSAQDLSQQIWGSI
jgi:tetraacyldisaccharide 4'-kinase